MPPNEGLVVPEIGRPTPYVIELTLRRIGDTAAAATFAGRFGGAARLGTAAPADVDVQPVQTGPPGGGMSGGLIANPRDFELSFAAGQDRIQVIIRVSVIQDGEIEEPKDLRLEVAGESLVVRLLEIREETPRLRFAREAATAAEGEVVAAVVVTVAPVSIVPLSVPVRVVAEGTTAPQQDYTLSGLAAGALSFAPGQPSASFQIALPDNDAADGARTLLLALDPGAGYELGVNSAYSLTITDDDPPAAGTPAVRFAVGESMVAEGAMVSAQLQAQPPPTAPLTVRLRLESMQQELFVHSY